MIGKFFKLAEAMESPSYTALVLDDGSHDKLLRLFPAPAGFEQLAHHMTINMGGKEKGPAASIVGSVQQLRVVGFGQDARVMAVSVESDVPSTNAVKHITVAVNRAAGGKPFHSNQLQFTPTSPVPLSGTVAEVTQGGKIIQHDSNSA